MGRLARIFGLEKSIRHNVLDIKFDFVAVDVETATGSINSICQIALVALGSLCFTCIIHTVYTVEILP